MAEVAAQLGLELPVFGPARTSIQLLQQLSRDGYSGDALEQIRRALSLASELFACRFQYSGEPFLVHAIGTASFLSSLRASPELVAAGLIHNAYGTGDFGDARPGASEWKRDVLRRAVGGEVEHYVYEFRRSLRWPPEKLRRLPRALPSMDARERGVVLLRLADLAEHHRDLGQIFGARQQEARKMLESVGSVWIELAQALASPAFADELKRLFEATASTVLPDAICGFTGHKQSFQLLPPSYRSRLPVALRRQTQWIRDLPRRGLARLRRWRLDRSPRP